ncbi:MAG: hypothetical protein NTV51_13440 [Verrucomicrobia bacterium]|nr:hypothetical protein [Verrucomicrobiota bacterium]
MNKIHRFTSALCASGVFLTAASLFAQVNGPGAVNDPKKGGATATPPSDAGFPVIGYVAIAVVVIVVAIVLLRKKKS